VIEVSSALGKLAGSLGATGIKKVLEKRAVRTQLLVEAGIKALPKPERRVLVEWISTDRVQELLTSPDESLRSHAVEGLELRLEQAGVELSTPLVEVVEASRNALLDQRPAARAIREEVDRLQVSQVEAELDQLPGARPADLVASPTARRALPPSVEALLRDGLSGKERSSLRQWLTSRPSAAGFQSLTKPGGLLEGMPAAAWEAAARMAHGAGFRRQAITLFEGAISRSPRPELVQPRLALILHIEGETEAASKLASDAASAPHASLLARALSAKLDGDLEAVAALSDEVDGDAGEHLAALLVVEALQDLDRMPEALALAERLAQDDEAADAKGQLAGLLLSRVLAGNSNDRTTDLNRARALARDSMRLRYSWGLQARQHVDIAVQAAMESADLQDVLNICDDVRAAGHGADLRNPSTTHVAALAALAHERDLDELDHLGEAERQYFQAVRGNLLDQEDPAARHERLERLRQLAARDDLGFEYRVHVLADLARADALGDDDLETLRDESPGTAQAIEALRLAARGEVRRAVFEAKGAIASGGAVPQHLASLLADLELYDELAQHVRSKWDEARDVTLLVYGLMTVVGVDLDPRTSDAAREFDRLGASALTLDTLTALQRRRLASNLVSLALIADDWEAADERLRVLLRCDISDGERLTALWQLAQVQVNRGYPKRAWELVSSEPQLPRPINTISAKLLAGMANTFSSSPGHVHQLLDFVDLDNEESSSALILGAWMLALRLDDEQAALAAHARVEAFVKRYPDSKVLYRRSIDDLIGDGGILVSMEPLPPQLVRLAEQVAVGMVSASFLTVASARNYTEILLSSGSYKHISSSSLVRRQRDRSSAASALGQPVVIDLTALQTLARLDLVLEDAELPRLAQRLLAALPSVSIAPRAALDAAMAQGSLDSDTHISPGTTENPRPVLTEEEEEVFERRRRELAKIAELAEQLDRAPDAEPRFLAEGELIQSENLRAALAALDTAAAHGHLAWLDDPHLRAMLQPADSFDTYSLLGALRQEGLLSDEEHHSAVAALRKVNVVVLPTPTPVVQAHARAVDFAVDGAAAVLMQPGFWAARYNLANERMDELLEALHDEAPAHLTAWMQCMTVGLVRQAGVGVAGRVLIYVLRYTDLSPEEALALAKSWSVGVRLVTGEQGTPQQLRDCLEEQEARIGGSFSKEFRDIVTGLEF
jgi:hypothetical protein